MSLPPLKGLRVLELAGLAPSNFAGLILADYGCDVVRVDRPGEVFGPKDSLVRGKRSIVIDLKSDSSRNVFLRLANAADIVIDPYRPGVLDRLGVGANVLCASNPRLIYAQLSGYRADSLVYGQRAGHDINYLGVSGVLSLFGRKNEAPAPPGNILGDFAGGGHVLVTGILLALIHRSSTGRGQVVRANMVDGAAYLATMPRQHLTQPAWNRPRGENLLDGAAPFYEVYKTADDRYITVGAQEPQFYAQLLTGLGMNSSELPDRNERTNWPALKTIFANKFKQKTLAEWRAIFDHTDACVAPVLHMDETESPHKPLVELSESPSLDISEQQLFPQLSKNHGAGNLLREWLPRDFRNIVVDDIGSRVLAPKL
ncbi:uncharacterized protein HMPREF1541_09070 [Cyphellophora europaea CBS 101466]|uniref:Alpha-methylacyl-CoA racemase n=1 Tax=Cyphellophora europaea (strain CBS 101466) TaxID=1220924 RepID=W2RJY5_CYPE1|nr:uncharacterized protein HMPREF1541_09070 [Cyphellophora europaea CBS 101466]ETN36792.1 hypothetical protein HMPREF1541_09070 [Cyphellophora europaea CBS 101466]